MNKKLKITSIIVGVILSIAMLSNVVFGLTASSILNGVSATNTSGVTSVQNIGNQIIGIITTIGVVAAVIVLLILGIKYMMGSASEKAEYKKTMIPYLIGAVLIFGASAIVKIVMGIGSGIVTP